MKIGVHGAAGEVTGSAYHVTTKRASILVDCGLFQGARTKGRNRVPRGLQVNRLDSIVLTHAHLDHTGRLPLLVKQGYHKPIHATPASIDVTKLILRDAAHLQVADTTRENRHRQRAGRPPLEPLYTPEDVERLERLFQPLDYHETREVAPGIQVRFLDAGHILGSASIEMSVEEAGHQRVIAFSGDVGPRGVPLLRDPEHLRSADVVFLESTYGDRDHRPLAETVNQLLEVLQRASADHGRILIPVFAVGRTQQILYHIAALFRAGAVPTFPIYLDSPMAIEATEIYARHRDLFDAEAAALVRSGLLRQELDTLHLCETAEDSRALNTTSGPCAILAGSGMCNGGRILHHLKHSLYRPHTHVVFVGYQGEGTLGRQIVDGKKMVKVLGEPIAVRAAIHTLGGFSAHAGQGELLSWLESLAPSRPRVILTHGEPRGRDPLAAKIVERFHLTVEKPLLDQVIEV